MLVGEQTQTPGVDQACVIAAAPTEQCTTAANRLPLPRPFVLLVSFVDIPIVPGTGAGSTKITNGTKVPRSLAAGERRSLYSWNAFNRVDNALPAFRSKIARADV